MSQVSFANIERLRTNYNSIDCIVRPASSAAVDYRPGGGLAGILAAVCLSVALGPAQAGVIDFETTGLTPGALVGPISTTDNLVTFSRPDNTNQLALADVGPAPARLANAPGNVVAGGNPGDYFLGGVPVGFGITFLNAITSLSLDLYDYRGYRENIDKLGGAATLSEYSGVARTSLLASSSFVVDPSGLPGLPVEGNVENLSVSSFGYAWGADLTFSAFNVSDPGNGIDGGTGIDNVTFSTAVPEPVTLAIMALGLAGAGFARRRPI